MAGRMLGLIVVKADGAREEYIHTKVVGTIANALSTAGQADISVAEELAEAVTFFLYRTGEHRDISSNEIFSIIKTVLAATSHEEEAAALCEHHFQRKLRRCRIEVVENSANGLEEAGDFYTDNDRQVRNRWDKSRIVEDLVAGKGLPRQTARAIASMVEERVFNMGISLVPAGLLKQLVLSDSVAVMRAQQQLRHTTPGNI